VEVYIVENEASGNKIKIKLKNASQEIWTLPEALEKK
jgi:hypothetical protein